jgi:MioC protein
MANIQVIVGTVMGTALRVATSMATHLQAAGHTVRVNEGFKKSDLANDDEILLVCTSNTGAGDLPPAMIPLFMHLRNDAPNLASRRYGIVNLGDSSYPTFAQAGHHVDDALQDVGATRVGEMLIIDAISGDVPEDLAKVWLEDWIQLL